MGSGNRTHSRSVSRNGFFAVILGNHSPYAMFDDAALPAGAAVLAEMAWRRPGEGA
jgi:hypothetical protein